MYYAISTQEFNSFNLLLGSGKPKESNDKRNFLADAMREMETGGKPLNLASVVRKVPNVIRVVMRPEVPPRRPHHRRHRNKHLGSLASLLKLAEGLSKFNKESRKNKTAERINTENTLQETESLLENVNGQLENMSKTHGSREHKMATKASSKTQVKDKDEVMVTDSFPLFPELRSIVEHGKPFNPDVTRAAFARAKQIVWDSVGQDPTNTDVAHLNNTKLTNAVALLEMAVREAEKMQRNKTNNVDQGRSAFKKIPETNKLLATPAPQNSKHDAHQLKILKDLLLEELKQANYTKDKAGILISDIPFQKLRTNEQANLMQTPSPATNDSSSDSKTSLTNNKPKGQTQALLEKYTSFITNILKAAHLSVVNNLTNESNKTNSATKNKTNLNLTIKAHTKQPDTQTQRLQHQSLEQSAKGEQTKMPKKQRGVQQMSFAKATQEEKQPQHPPQPFLSKERLAARKAFGTAQKMVKALLARQELYKAENEFFNKIHEMLNKTSLNNAQTVSPDADARESKFTSQPTVASPIQSPLSQSPINTASDPSIGSEGNQKQTSEAQKKFEEAAHLEEKVAAQQDEMYDALMTGHTIGTVKGDGGFDEEGATRETPVQDGGVDDSYNAEDYGDFKDSDEEAERKFYHDHRQDDFEAKAGDDSSFSLRNKITSRKLKHSSGTDFSGSGLPFGMSGDRKTRNNLQSKIYKHSNILNALKVHDRKTKPKRSEINSNHGHTIKGKSVKTPNLEIQVL